MSDLMDEAYTDYYYYYYQVINNKVQIGELYSSEKAT